MTLKRYFKSRKGATARKRPRLSMKYRRARRPRNFKRSSRKYGRSRRKWASALKPIRLVYRFQNILTCDANGIISDLQKFNKGWANDAPGHEAVAILYDQFKCGQHTVKYRPVKSAEVTNDVADDDIVHWKAWDPDAQGRELTPGTALTNIRYIPHATWKVMKPYDVHTSTMRPKFNTVMFGTNAGDVQERTVSGDPRVNNPWWDLGNQSNQCTSSNGVHHVFKGKAAAGAYQIEADHTVTFLYRGLRQGQLYALHRTKAEGSWYKEEDKE